MDPISELRALYLERFGIPASAMIPLKQSGSNRQYFRMKGPSNTVIGTFGNDINENKAFFYLTQHFTKKNIPVPHLLAVSKNFHCYLQEDIGDHSLFGLIEHSQQTGDNYSTKIDAYYRKVISHLVHIQQEASAGLNYRKCYPYHSFGIESILFDLRYFVFYFAKIFDLNFNELKLEREFRQFAKMLVSGGDTCFMYRDFQSRNIFIKNDDVIFIDYQAGRKGAPQYDLASLLYQAKAMIPEEKRQELLQFYIDYAGIKANEDRNKFTQKYYMYVCVRLLQTLGAYGLRGIIEQKPHFIQSIPQAVANLKNMLPVFNLKQQFPEMQHLLLQTTQIAEINEIATNKESSKLDILLFSFSYLKGVPRDYSGNGGGFLFDCRGLLNPGKIDKFRVLTGNDDEVKTFLEKSTEANQFVENAYKVVKTNINTYIERNFNSLMIGFGCTGGRHRSVYCCNKMAEILSIYYKRDDVVLTVWHKEQNIKYVVEK